MAKSAENRHHVARLKNKRKDYWGRRWGAMNPLTPKQLNIVVRTPKNCDCWMCNSPRERFGKPFDEVRLDVKAKFDLNNPSDKE